MDVISLVSSDEEDNDGVVRNKIKSNKNLTVKKVKHTPRVQTNVSKTPIQTVTSRIFHSQNKTVIVGYRHNQSLENQQPIKIQQKTPFKQTKLVFSPQKSKDGKTIESKKTLNLSTSGITITPVKSSQIKATEPNVNLLAAKQKTNSVTITPKSFLLSNVRPVRPVQQNTQPAIPANVAISKPAKRIIPTKISNTVTSRTSSIDRSSDSDMMSRDSSTVVNGETNSFTINCTNQPDEHEPPTKRQKIGENSKIMHNDYKQLIDVCRNADPTKDMEKIISKLEKYYERAHLDFINSKSFHKLVEKVTEEIKSNPKFVYMKINNLMGELKTRRANETPETHETPEAPEEKEANEKKTKKINKLNKALQILQHKIRLAEEADVDLDDEYNSKYLETERFKKRAVEIYEKICDITGESKNAERNIKKPIQFRGTSYREFNHKLEQFVNKTKSFPDMFDVLRIMDHCNKLHNYKMSTEERKTIAQKAFRDIGKLLQKRRKTDLYEMVQYFTANVTDPAAEDDALKSKLEENHRHYSKRMDEVIEKFAEQHGGNRNESDVNDEMKSPVKAERDIETIGPNRINPTTSAPLINLPEVITDDLNLAADDDMLNDSVTFISDDEFTNIAQDSLLMEQDDEDLAKEFYPMIKSVTSLRPEQFNEFMKFDQTSLENSNIL